MDPTVISMLAFLGVSGLVGIAAFVLRDSGNNRNVERLDQLVGRGGPAAASSSQSDMLLKQALDSVNTKSLLQRLIPKSFDVGLYFEQADVKMEPSKLFGVALCLAGAGFFLIGGVVNFYVAPVGALVFGVMPLIWVWFKRASRLKKFANQMPDAMELMARALRAGHSLNSGMHVVAEELPPPISKEFARVYDEQNMGISVEEALDNMSRRIPNLDVRFFVTSVAIQRQTGGDLGEILDRIGYIIRERIKIMGLIKGLTAEGRLSGIVLIALPIGLFLMLLQMKPDYVEQLWKDPMGVQMSIGAIILMLIGAYSIKKIVDIKV
ncbi:type II secretion system F family protein [Telmatocola sphagniphila]|uniref:Type II secretion system F family protein n=1 Tax=Telmatocola sphagniphila TaxID=1123043 RepID=A0A8E6BA49_9BACT|nr:type II secretion system F family protein [Telmatocola sphagniphila]QVL34184.1 type II secretion system F family protein [Telmatocola sphagniphila]